MLLTYLLTFIYKSTFSNFLPNELSELNKIMDLPAYICPDQNMSSLIGMVPEKMGHRKMDKTDRLTNKVITQGTFFF